MRNLAFGVRFDSFEFGGSLFHPLSPSLLGLLPILLFRLFGVERHYTISLLIYSFIFFSFAGSLKTAEGGGGEFVAGVGGMSRPIQGATISLPSRSFSASIFASFQLVRYSPPRRAC